MVLYHDIFGNKELFVTVDNLVLLEPFMYLTKKDPINNINTNRVDVEQNKVSLLINKPRSSVYVTDSRSVKSTDDETIEILPQENVIQKVPIPNSDKKQHNTPLNILNGTPEGVPLDVSRATLPINQLKNTVIKDDRSNSNVHRCKMPGIFPRKPDNLFWCIYIALYGYGEYHQIGHRYGNIEMEEKQKMVEMMKKSPAVAKQCSKKITKALFQEIMSDFMTNKKMTMDMLTMVSIYHNKNFIIAHCTDSGESEPYFIKIIADQETSCCLLYKRAKSDYSIMLDPEPSILENISNTRFRFENHDMPLKAVSNYKTSELEDIFDILEIDREKDKKYKKEDYYHAIMRRCGL